jgi:hypothetical protein
MRDGWAMPDHPKLIDGYPKRGGRYCCLVVLVSLAAVTMAACIADTPPPAAPTQLSRPIPRKPAKPHHQPVMGNSATAAPGEAQSETPPAQSEVPAPQSEAPAEQPAQTALAGPAPSELIGLDEQRTTALLGPAAAMEARAPATVWHYKGARCSLHLTFYMEMRSGRMRTLHAEFKGDAATPERRQTCLKAIIEENRKAEPS